MANYEKVSGAGGARRQKFFWRYPAIKMVPPKDTCLLIYSEHTLYIEHNSSKQASASILLFTFNPDSEASGKSHKTFWTL